MPERQKPLLRRGGLTNRVYLVTRYKDHGDHIEAVAKVDITEQYDALRAEDDEHQKASEVADVDVVLPCGCVPPCEGHHEDES